MNRRKLLVRLAVCALSTVTVLPVGAQPTAVPVVGFLGGTAPAPDIVKPFLQGLADAGYDEGRNVQVEYRWAHDRAERLPGLVADLLRSGASVIVTSGGLVPAQTAKATTTTVPVVFEVGRDPIGAGLVASLNRPGGNVTGVYMLTSALNAKRLELLYEMVPRVKTMAALFNPRNAGAAAIQHELQVAAAATGVQLVFFSAASEQEIEAAFATMAEKRIGALVVTNDPFFNNKRERLVALTTRFALPSIFEWRDFTILGGLMSYGTDLAAVHREVGVYAARILNGAKPADLPVSQPTRFELVINRRSASALGLVVPQSLLLRADEVLQ